MTKIKLCGMVNLCDIDYVNELMPDFVGFVFAPKSRRCVTPERAEMLSNKLNGCITPVGVFVDETVENIAYLVNHSIIRAVQLHGSEDNDYISALRSKIHCPVLQAFSIKSKLDIAQAVNSKADYILLDSGGGSGKTFNHSLISGIKRDFFLAGGLDSENVYEAVLKYKPYAVDASSSLEINGEKDKNKMKAFVRAVRSGGKEK